MTSSSESDRACVVPMSLSKSDKTYGVAEHLIQSIKSRDGSKQASLSGFKGSLQPNVS